MQHARDGNGVFVSRDIAELDVVGLCYGSLAYSDVGRRIRSRKQ